jgi:hypothetical protein
MDGNGGLQLATRPPICDLSGEESDHERLRGNSKRRAGHGTDEYPSSPVDGTFEG